MESLAFWSEFSSGVSFGLFMGFAVFWSASVSRGVRSAFRAGSEIND
jgi:hypothetical protein